MHVKRFTQFAFVLAIFALIVGLCACDEIQQLLVVEPPEPEPEILEDTNDWTGTWSFESQDGQSLEQGFAEEFAEDNGEGAIDFTVVTNRYTFNSDGTMESEVTIAFEIAEEGLEFSAEMSIRQMGTYSLSGSNYTMSGTTEVTGPFGYVETTTDEDAGTWSREGDTLTLNSDDGITIVLKKKTGEAVDPPSDDIEPPPATRVEVDPAPGSTIPSNQGFTLTFDAGVTAANVNGAPATGSGANWTWTAYPPLEEGSATLEIGWTNRDGSDDSQMAGPYTVVFLDTTPPSIIASTVEDGYVDVNPFWINVEGIQIEFDEPVTGTIALTDEDGNDLNWIGTVEGQTATLMPIAGAELANETIYKVKIDVQDGAGNLLRTTIIFVTKPWE